MNLTTMRLPFHPAIADAYLRVYEAMSKSGRLGRVLDLCCGSGLHTPFLVRHSESYQGVDLNSKFIEEAKASFLSGPTAQNISFHTMEGITFLKSLEDQSIDTVFVSGGLYYFPNQTTLLNELHRVLKPSGRIYAVETNGSNFLLNTYRRIKNFIHPYRDHQTTNKLLSAADYNETFEKLNFNVSVEPLDSWVPMIALLPARGWLTTILLRLVRYIDSVLLRSEIYSTYFAFKMLIVATVSPTNVHKK